MSVNIADKNNVGFNGTGSFAIEVAYAVPCASTPDATVGSTCSGTTSLDALLGGPTAITEQKRAIWVIRSASLYDGGPDGVATTLEDNTVFAVGGIVLPMRPAPIMIRTVAIVAVCSILLALAATAHAAFLGRTAGLRSTRTATATTTSSR